MPPRSSHRVPAHALIVRVTVTIGEDALLETTHDWLTGDDPVSFSTGRQWAHVYYRKTASRLASRLNVERAVAEPVRRVFFFAMPVDPPDRKKGERA